MNSVLPSADMVPLGETRPLLQMACKTGGAMVEYAQF